MSQRLDGGFSALRWAKWYWWLTVPITQLILINNLRRTGFTLFYLPSGFKATQLQKDLRVHVYKTKRGFRVRVSPVTVPPGFALFPGNFSKGRKVLTGAVQFDQAFDLQGIDQALTLAVVDSAVRNLAWDLQSFEIDFLDGKMNGFVGHASEVIKAVEKMILMAERLNRPFESVAARLAQNAEQERLSRVRLRNLYYLQKEFSNSLEASQASERALHDRDLGLRFLGASFLGKPVPFQPPWKGLIQFRTTTMEEALRFVMEDGYPVDKRKTAHILSNLLNKTVHQMLETQVRLGAMAIGGVKNLFSYTEKEGLREQFDFVMAVLEALRKLNPASLAESVALLARLQAVEIQREVLKMLERRGSSWNQEAVIPLLQSYDDDVQIRAARIVGAIGGREAILPLIRMRRRSRLFSTARSVAANAIDRIRARLGPAERGTLAVAEETEKDEGAVSIAEGEGNVSLKNPEERESAES